MARSTSRTGSQSMVALLLCGALALGGCAGQATGQDPAAGAPTSTSEASDVAATPDGAGQLGQ
jgi:PBP1b-binding outer membrane lipoprotein LpoB